MQAMILAAGLGSRMRPLTHVLPKPLFPVLNTPSIERIMSSLMEQGFGHIYVNLFHLASRIADFLTNWLSSKTINLLPIIEPFLLGTGGALVNASPYFIKDSPLLLINSDVVCNVNFRQFWEDHTASGAIATILVHNKEPYNKLDVRNGLLTGFENNGNAAVAYTGIACFSPVFFRFLPKEMPCSLIDGFKNALKMGYSIRALPLVRFSHDGVWEDIGTVAGYLAAHKQLLAASDCLIQRGHDCRLAPGVRVEEWGCLGDRVCVGENAVLRASVIWNDCSIGAHALIENSVVSTFGILR
ncbi:MAG: NDP-sugar synthase [Deltaproteobacteria bacterium]|jgi:NDP-sugar pyrophosphorylase family protein|nr:NDP-sugar synthase [Deltaproteobacteria bacterium]